MQASRSRRAGSTSSRAGSPTFSPDKRVFRRLGEMSWGLFLTNHYEVTKEASEEKEALAKVLC